MSIKIAHERLQVIVNTQETEQYVTFPLTSGVMSENGGTTWVTPLELGTPGQKLNIMLDSGTLNTWITDSQCTTHACEVHGAFNAAASSTFKPSSKPSKVVDFGPWGSMTVSFGSDIVRLQSNVAGCFLEGMDLMLATNYEGKNFAELVADGGFAIPAIPDDEATALLNQLYQQELVTFPVASFFLDRAANRGECRIGAPNIDLFDVSTVQKLELVTPAGGDDLAYLWAVRMDSLMVGDTPVYDCGDNKQLVLDSGASFFKGCADIINPIIAAVTQNGALPTKFSDASKLADYQPLAITLSGKTYTLPPEQYFTCVGNEYVLAIQVLDGLPIEMLLVGEIFLETVYTIFDYGLDTNNERGIYLAEPIFASSSASDLSGAGIIGDWENQFGSVMSIKTFSPEGVFTGTYSSSTGATGIYPLVGTADPAPTDSQTVAFSVTWKSLQGAYDPSWHWVSSFAGYRAEDSGEDVIQGTFLLQQTVDENTPNYLATAVSSLTFKRKQ